LHLVSNLFPHINEDARSKSLQIHIMHVEPVGTIGLKNWNSWVKKEKYLCAWHYPM